MTEVRQEDGTARLWAGVGDWPAPHPDMPKATARKGTRRMPPRVRELLGKPLTRELAHELIATGQLDPARCTVVWNVNDCPVAQPARDLAVPAGLGVLPIRRIGTHQDATNLIAMYPVLRDGWVLMISMESRLELGHTAQLSFDPDVSTIYAQPFAMVWRHPLGNLVRVPDLAAVIGGRLCVFEVKPEHRLRDEYTRLSLDFMAHTLRLAGTPFELLGALTAQRRHNLLLLARYRWPNPFLVAEVEAVRDARPASWADAVKTIERLSDVVLIGRHAYDLQTLRVASEVVRHLLATGACHTDLDAPLGLTSVLDWGTRASLLGVA